MKYKLWSLFFTLLGFAAAIGFPVWAVSSQVVILRDACQNSVFDRFNVAIGGVALIAFIVFLTVWRYVSVLIRETLRPQRTLLGFFGVGYVMILIIRQMIGALEVIFLGGLIGAAVAAVCFFISDRIKERGNK